MTATITYTLILAVIYVGRRTFSNAEFGMRNSEFGIRNRRNSED
ncbi:MAG: hypothetical protein ACOYNO_04645 [Saprospiraceae bacterium]